MYLSSFFANYRHQIKMNGTSKNSFLCQDPLNCGKPAKMHDWSNSTTECTWCLSTDYNIKLTYWLKLHQTTNYIHHDSCVVQNYLPFLHVAGVVDNKRPASNDHATEKIHHNTALQKETNK